MKVGLMTATILAALAVPVLAGPTAISPPGPAYHVELGTRDLACVFQQTEYSQFGAAVSQVDTFYPFEAWVADDFICEPCLPVTHIEWGGAHWGYGTFGAPSSFIIWIWEDQGNCVPGLPPDSGEIYKETVTEYEYAPIENDYYWYAADVPSFDPAPGVLYWMSIQAVLDFEPNGLWGWMFFAEQWNCSALQYGPAFDIYEWSDEGWGDVVFALYSDGVDTEDSSWSSVKALY